MSRSFILDVNFPVFIERARRAEKLSRTDGYWALDAILNSAIALEALPNDIVRELQHTHEFTRGLDCQQLPESLINVSRIMPDVESAGPQVKFQILYALLCGKTFERGAQPFQDFNFLIKLRNEIVHPKCERIERGVDKPYEENSQALIKGILSKSISHLPKNVHLPWKRHLENDKAASWAVGTARAMIYAIRDAVPDSYLRRSLVEHTAPESSLNRPM